MLLTLRHYKNVRNISMNFVLRFWSYANLENMATARKLEIKCDQFNAVENNAQKNGAKM
jgi:hypothetical protein